MNINYDLVFGADKVGHFLLFFFISFFIGVLILLIIDRSYLVKSLRIVWIYLVLLGIFEEYRQLYIVNRSAEFLDAVANLIGVTGGLMVPMIIALILVRKQQQQNSGTVYLIYLIILLPLLIGLWQLNELPFWDAGTGPSSHHLFTGTRDLSP
ncbi:VanZ family protein [Fredinandcohnia onubensis]|uniref:VanZ family protein n=1 Tax=Fredinandcohnia onubensis TaxID=1571209 RepID=UPI000C0BF70C|nr:VanZ family protein [Fredinandcohnia onubensis]